MIVRNSTMPMINPVLRPIANSSTTKTIVTALPRLKMKSLVAWVTASGWKLMSPISIPIGWSRFSSSSFRRTPFAHRHDVAALHRGDAQADGRLAVVAEQAARRILIAAIDRRDVLQEELAARLIRPDHQFEHFLGRAETALSDRWRYADLPTRTRPPSAATFFAWSWS